MALELFHYQYQNNKVYKNYVDLLQVKPEKVTKYHQIPHLPIQFFKTQKILTGNLESAIKFSSSGTGGEVSQHWVHDLDLYEESFSKAFEWSYGNVENHCVLGLLPSYLEREGSSLIYMVEQLIQRSENPSSGFYLNEWDKLIEVMVDNEKKGQKTLLIGVTFALLDFAEKAKLQLKHTIIMETGGMKGRRKEMLRSEVHKKLKEAFGVKAIHSEYGMTELLSQAYSKGGGHFATPQWMKVSIRDTDDPFSKSPLEKTGGLNIIDLANIDSCCFIETQDLGRLFADGTFEIMGRFDHSDIRGCNLMMI